MKKIIIQLLILCIFLLFSACHQSQESHVEYHEPKGYAEGMFRSYSYNNLIAMDEIVIVEVEVLEEVPRSSIKGVGEYVDDIEMIKSAHTYHEVRIIEEFTKKLIDVSTIIITQFGTRDYPLEHIGILNPGERFILFLIKNPTTEPSTYYLTSPFSSIYDIETYNGNEYVKRRTVADIYPDDIKEISLPMKEAEKKGTGLKREAKYTQKYRLHDLENRIKSDLAAKEGDSK